MKIFKNFKLVPFLPLFILGIYMSSCNKQDELVADKNIEANGSLELRTITHTPRYWVDTVSTTSAGIDPDTSFNKPYYVHIHYNPSDSTEIFNDVYQFTTKAKLFAFGLTKGIDFESQYDIADHVAVYAAATGAIDYYDKYGDYPAGFEDSVRNYVNTMVPYQGQGITLPSTRLYDNGNGTNQIYSLHKLSLNLGNAKNRTSSFRTLDGTNNFCHDHYIYDKTFLRKFIGYVNNCTPELTSFDDGSKSWLWKFNNRAESWVIAW